MIVLAFGFAALGLFVLLRRFVPIEAPAAAADAPTPEVPADLDPLNPAAAAAKLKMFPQEPEL